MTCFRASQTQEGDAAGEGAGGSEGTKRPPLSGERTNRHPAARPRSNCFQDFTSVTKMPITFNAVIPEVLSALGAPTINHIITVSLLTGRRAAGASSTLKSRRERAAGGGMEGHPQTPLNGRVSTPHREKSVMLNT